MSDFSFYFGMKYEPACFCEMKQQVLLVSCACFKDSAPFVRYPPQLSPSERPENPSLFEEKRNEGVSVGGGGRMKVWVR